jgi:UDP-N-acetyl-D-glucosamine dehydrogenase
LSKINERTAQIAVVGLGYVGLPLALLFCDRGFPVTGLDVDTRKVQTLTEGHSYIYRIPAIEIQVAREKGLRATSDYSDLRAMDVIIVCVPTPLTDYREPDMSYVTTTMEAIAPHIQRGQLIVLESTTYPGTTEEVVIPILQHGNAAGLVTHHEGHDGNVFFVAFSPEREDPGNNTIARHDIPKVVGGASRASTELAAALYGSIFKRSVAVSSPVVAEMTKLLENIYRCVNIALVNELKLLCLRMNIDIWEVIDAASTKPFGFQPFYPGPGLGGHCIPIDPFYLSWRAKQWDFPTRFIELAGEINLAMPYHVVDSVMRALGKRRKTMNGSKVLVLGLAYKKDIDDLRESPSLTIIKLLQNSGATVDYHDPYFPTVGEGRKYTLNMTCASLEDIGKYDCVIIVTDHSDYDYPRIVHEAQLVVDTRNATRGMSFENIVRC